MENQITKVRVIVDMFGGTIEAIRHDNPAIQLDVVFTENVKYSDRKDETMIDEDTFLYSRQESEADKVDVDMVFRSIEHQGGEPPALTNKDWAEIYYALEHKLTSAAVDGDEEWIGHIKNIMETIGPDGCNMTEGAE